MTNDSETVSFRRITELPFIADDEFFRQYPGFKLGVTRCVRYYAQLLLPLVRQLIASDSEHSDWILTAPAVTAQTPAAANLLCWELFDLYARERRQELTLIDMQHDDHSTWAAWKDPTKSQDYAKLEFADRVTEHEKLSRRLGRKPYFSGRPILFVNDIRVTGAQQLAMQRYFDEVGAACVRWLYLIVTDPEIGRAEPRLEWQINFTPFDELLRMVSQEQIQFTGKCVQRLMSLSIVELTQVLNALDEERRTRLLEISIRNGFEGMAGFREQLELVRSYETVV